MMMTYDCMNDMIMDEYYINNRIMQRYAPKWSLKLDLISISFSEQVIIGAISASSAPGPDVIQAYFWGKNVLLT